MDITKFIVTGRSQAFLYGDHGAYQRQLGKKLLNCRRKLGTATKTRGKFQKKASVTAEQIAESHENLHLLLLTSERAWANAMAMKGAHSTDTKGITSKTRSHIISRLDKAAKSAESLVDLLSSGSAAGATPTDVLEAKAYAALLRGTEQFEKKSWEPCVRSYSISRVIYSALATSSKGDMYTDLLSETVDPSIRYAAYRLQTERTVPIPVIARNAFPQTDTTLVREINRLNPSILKASDPDSKKTAEAGPKTLTWRSREVRIEDAAIAVAWASIQSAKQQLAKSPASSGEDPKGAAQAYDEILTASQDAVDATKQAIDELRGEGVSQNDTRMQSLQITWTAVNYEMITWRIGRNRVLTGERDGALEELQGQTRRNAKKAEKAEEPLKKAKEEKPARRIAKLKEKVALYDSTLQSLESVLVLPGIPADKELSAVLRATGKYFTALKALSIARSHAIAGDDVNALALVDHASAAASDALPALAKAPAPAPGSPRSMQVSAADASSLSDLLAAELQRHRAIVHIAGLRREAAARAAANPSPPLVDRLDACPEGGAVDLANLVQWPPKLRPVPGQPIFLDVAWNYIEYPRDGKAATAAAPKGKDVAEGKDKSTAQQKKGWFGFGR